MENIAAWFVGYLIAYVVLDLIKKMSRPEYYLNNMKQPYPALTSKQTVKYIQEQDIKPIDMICLSPILDPYTLTSIKTFMPWVRRVHVQTDTSSTFPHVITFQKPIHEYALTSPYLSDRIVVLQPYTVLTNFVYPWHFFIHDIAYDRPSSPLIPILKADLADFGMSVYNDILKHVRRYPKRRSKPRWDGYHDVSEQCGMTMASAQTFKTFQTSELEKLVRIPAIPSSDKTAIELEICVIAQPYDDIAYYPGPVADDHVKRLWVLCQNQLHDTDKLRFLQRCFAQNHMFHFMDPYDYKFVADTGAAMIMRWIRSTIPDPIPLEVKKVYANTKDKEMKEVAERLAAGYEIAMTPLPKEANTVYPYDIQRLRSL